MSLDCYKHKVYASWKGQPQHLVFGARYAHFAFWIAQEISARTNGKAKVVCSWGHTKRFKGGQVVDKF